MNEILNLPINEMAETEFDCSCGKHHNFSIHDIAIGAGTLPELARIAAPFKDGKILLISDNKTRKVAGEQALAILQDAGFNVKELVFDCGDDMMIPDESVIGRVVEDLDLDVSLMVSVGSGSLNDTAKFVSSRTKIPYVICATAPSMDGYVADGAPLINMGKKISYPACLAYGVIGDTNIMKDAPMRMIQAGFGDVVGKITALTDWDLSVQLNDEYRCQTCVTLVDRAMQKCFSQAEGLPKRDSEAVLYLIEALTLTGVAMGLVGVSRPASGAEHMLSHFWEMDFIARGLEPEFHGIKVGVATTVIARIFEEMGDLIPESTKALLPPHEEIEALLKKAGCPTSPTEIRIDRELFKRSLLEGYTVRPRYSVLRYAKEQGRLEEIAEKLTNEYYGEAK